jgi:hypothetical protein
MEKTYTIVRNGVIKRTKHGDHYCGFSRTRNYPYRVELTVRGELRPPDYFILANEMVDEVVQKRLRDAPPTSCEKMCDDICDAVLDHMATEHAGQWQVLRCHTQLTGTNGLALLSCDVKTNNG